MKDDKDPDESELWALREFGEADLKDRRRTKRIVKMATGLAREPGRTMSGSSGRNGAQAVSRLMNREEVTEDSVLEAHAEATGRRCSAFDLVLAVQDTCYLDFSSHPSTEGLGPIGSEGSLGLCCHSVLMLDPDRTPVGLAGMSMWARDPELYGSRGSRRKRPVCEKESNKWLSGLKQVQKHVPPDTLVVMISDRESDVYEYLSQERADNVHLLLRIVQDRNVVVSGGDGKRVLLFTALENAPVVGQYEIEVPASGTAPARVATLDVHLCELDVQRPVNARAGTSREPVHISAVWAHELDAPPGAEPLDWKLGATFTVDGLDGAMCLIDFYSGRWTIEEFHRVLKSGCNVEKMQFDDDESLKPAIALNAVVACRVLHMTKMARKSPDGDVSLVASPVEVRAAESCMESHGERGLTTITTIHQFVRAVALMGGFMGRKGDGEPGTKVLWQGLRFLSALVEGFRLGFAAAELSP